MKEIKKSASLKILGVGFFFFIYTRKLDRFCGREALFSETMEKSCVLINFLRDSRSSNQERLVAETQRCYSWVHLGFLRRAADKRGSGARAAVLPFRFLPESGQGPGEVAEVLTKIFRKMLPGWSLGWRDTSD